MSEDIVERLRNCDCIPHCLCGEAAGEIERLRSLIADREAEITDRVLGFTKDVWWTPGHRDRVRCEAYAASRGFTCFRGKDTDGK